MDGLDDSFLPLCVRLAGVAPCVILPLSFSHTEAIHRVHKSSLPPHFLPMPSIKIASLGIVEGGLRESALGAPRTPSCHSPSDSGAQLNVTKHPHSEVFEPFPASVSPRSIPSGKSAHVPDQPLAFRTRFGQLNQDEEIHSRTLEFAHANGVDWSQQNVGREVCSLSSFTKAE